MSIQNNTLEITLTISAHEYNIIIAALYRQRKSISDNLDLLSRSRQTLTEAEDNLIEELIHSTDPLLDKLQILYYAELEKVGIEVIRDL